MTEIEAIKVAAVFGAWLCTASALLSKSVSGIGVLLFLGIALILTVSFT